MASDAGSKVGGGTTQRVDFETLSRIKTLNYHLMRSKGIRISQARIIAYAVGFALSQEAEFLEYISSGKLEPKESTFDVLVKATGKPWFPYGNLVKLD